MTIKEIAQLAGVSNAAVSRYLNGGYVSEGKKEQIRKVIEETGYQPSAQARMLRTKKASLVGVVVPKINSESISQITAGIESVLAERGYQMLLAGTDNTPVKEVEYLRLFENYPVDGIILVGTMFTAGHRKFLKETKVPVVVIGQRTSHANCIYHDDYGAGKAMGQAVAGGIPTIHFGYKTSGIRGAELLLDSIERGEQIPIEMKLGFRLVGADPSDSENLT